MADVLVVKSGGAAAFPEWVAAFAEVAPGLEVRLWGDPALDPARITHAFVWDPEPGALARLPNLRVVFGAGAGVDLIIADPAYPAQVPLVRMGAPAAAQRMGEYVCWAALSLLKDARRMAIAQAERRWDFFETPFTAAERVVGILGLGAMGERSAAMLRGLGFPVIGWSRTPKQVAGVESLVGPEGLDALLARANMLAVLLPATEATRGLIAAPLLARTRPGVGIILAGRGVQTHWPDLLQALESGQVGGVVADVFDPEPLPAESAIWSHPRVTVTAHIASLASRRERAAFVADALARHQRGEALPTLYVPARGY